MSAPLRVLVLCTGNSARSQMAEALLNARGGGTIAAESAGSCPVERVNPLAVEALKAIGIAWGGKEPRHVDDLDRTGWDLVLTVCDEAREACPIFPGSTVMAHWGQPDPAAAGGGLAGVSAFREALDLLEWRIGRLVALNLQAGTVDGVLEIVRKIGLESPDNLQPEM
ncbi:MAG: arsenate reductase ArsC [Gemmatimonadota bacterium]|nr:arsenate reductase ArsC [Gemmatimonadota bacterium]